MRPRAGSRSAARPAPRTRTSRPAALASAGAQSRSGLRVAHSNTSAQQQHKRTIVVRARLCAPGSVSCTNFGIMWTGGRPFGRCSASTASGCTQISNGGFAARPPVHTSTHGVRVFDERAAQTVASRRRPVPFLPFAFFFFFCLGTNEPIR